MKPKKNKSSSLRKKLWVSFTIIAVVTLLVSLILIANLESIFMDRIKIESMNGAVPLNSETLLDYLGRSVQRFQTTILISTTVIILSIVIAGIYLNRTVLQPIERTTIAAKKIATGRLDKIIPIYAKDEIGDLGEQINDIAMNAQEILLYMWNKSGQLSEFLTNVSSFLNSGRNEIMPETVLEQIANAESTLKEIQSTIESFGLYGVKLDKDKVLESDRVA